MKSQQPISPIRSVLALLLTTAALAGCARRYDMILTNNEQVTNVRKPTFHEASGYYTFLDSKGRTNYISIARVVEIHPHERVDFKAPDTH
jgi:hypothetical protein